MILVSKRRKFELYISRILKEIDSKLSITLNSKQQLGSALEILGKAISSLAFDLSVFAEKKTISSLEIENAVKVLFKDNFPFILVRATEAVNQYTNRIEPGSRQKSSGLVIPPALCERMLRNFGLWKVKITGDSAIYLAAILEGFLREFLLSCKKECDLQDKVRLSIRHLELAVRKNFTFSSLFRTCKIQFLGGGVLPRIHEELLQKGRVVKRRKIQPLEERKRRFRPGTVALREIRRLQKTSNVLYFSKLPFQRLTREILEDLQGDFPQRISKKTFLVLQYYSEQAILGILQKANLLAIHAGRIKVQANDISLVCRLEGEEIENEEENFSSEIETENEEEPAPSKSI